MINQKIEQSKQKMKQLAFGMASELPDDLLDYLDPFLPPTPNPTPVHAHPKAHRPIMQQIGNASPSYSTFKRASGVSVSTDVDLAQHGNLLPPAVSSQQSQAPSASAAVCPCTEAPNRATGRTAGKQDSKLLGASSTPNQHHLDITTDQTATQHSHECAAPSPACDEEYQACKAEEAAATSLASPAPEQQISGVSAEAEELASLLDGMNLVVESNGTVHQHTPARRQHAAATRSMRRISSSTSSTAQSSTTAPASGQSILIESSSLTTAEDACGTPDVYARGGEVASSTLIAADNACGDFGLVGDAPGDATDQPASPEDLSDLLHLGQSLSPDVGVPLTANAPQAKTSTPSCADMPLDFAPSPISIPRLPFRHATRRGLSRVSPVADPIAMKAASSPIGQPFIGSCLPSVPAPLPITEEPLPGKPSPIEAFRLAYHALHPEMQAELPGDKNVTASSSSSNSSSSCSGDFDPDRFLNCLRRFLTPSKVCLLRRKLNKTVTQLSLTPAAATAAAGM